MIDYKIHHNYSRLKNHMFFLETESKLANRLTAFEGDGQQCKAAPA